MKRILLSFIIFFFLCVPAWATTYYIDYGAANNSANGTTTSTPWKVAPGMVGWDGTYSHSAGDIFVFKGGVTWPATTLPLTIGNSGSAGNVDTYMGGQLLGTPWGTGYAVFDGENDLGANASIITMTNKSYIAINGLKLIDVGDPATASGTCITMYGGSNIEIKNFWLQPEGIQAFGYTTNGSNESALYIHDGRITRAGRAVIYGDTGDVLDDVQIYNILWDGIDDVELYEYHADGLMVGNPNTAVCTSGGVATVTNIVMHHVYFRGDWSQGATAQYYSNGCTNNTTLYNNVFSIEHTGGATAALSPGFVVLYQKDGGTINIWNNTFSSDSSPGYGTGSNRAIAIYPPSGTDIIIKGNIFSGPGINVNVTSGYNSLTMDYNKHNPSSVGGYGHLLWINTTSYATLAAIRAIGLEENSPAVGTPLFTAVPNGTEGSGNFSPQSSSTVIDAFPTASAPTGTFTTDYAGTSRPQGAAWDIGAYEYEAEPEGAAELSAGAPSGFQFYTGTTKTLSLTTDVNATCKYGTTADTAYASIANTFTGGGGTSHTASVNVSPSTSYTYYARCIVGETANLNDYPITFSVGKLVGTTRSGVKW